MLPEYSYSPKALLESFQALKANEDAALKETVETDSTALEAAGAAASGEAPAKKRKVTTTTTLTNSSFTVAAIQLTAGGLKESESDGFYQRAKEAVKRAAEDHGADLILLPELFLGPYFCQSQVASLMGLACEANQCFVVKRMQQLAKLYNVVLPISIYEQSNNVLYNSVVMIDANGDILGTYRKSHIPDGIGYQEKFYFSPGDTGFRVWDTKVGKVGVAICWDQWFPEAARAMALQGADILLYPTAIGSEPQDPTINSADHWQRTMQGHSAANMIPLVASNRFGTEILLNDDGTEKQRITFYGRSFITDATGGKVTEATINDSGDDCDPISIITSVITPEKNRSTRLAWGLFRDRRPELYGALQTKDGKI